MNVRIYQTVGECRECPFCKYVTSETKDVRYHVCSKKSRILPRIVAKNYGGVNFHTIEIPDWCPFRGEGE